MKKLAAVLALCATLVGCESSNDHGNCIGAFDDGNPNTRYETSTLNVLLGLVFAETIVVPAVVILKETKCPK